MSDPGETQTVEISEDLLSRIDARVTHTEFQDRDAYISHLLEEILHDIEQGNDLTDSEEVDEQQVEERLKSLGYLNE